MASINIFIVGLQRGALIFVAPTDYGSTTISNAVSYSVSGKESSGEGLSVKNNTLVQKWHVALTVTMPQSEVVAWLKLTKKKTRTFIF